MPIEIRELVIKAVVNNNARQSDPEGAVDERNDLTRESLNMEEIVQQVLELLQENRNER